MVREEDVGVGEDAAASGQGGSEVCGGWAKGGKERDCRLAVLRSAIGGARGSWIHGEERERRGAAVATTNVWTY
jgi:hypothetical protein